MALEEGRILLTSDKGFLEHKQVRDEEISLLMVPHLPVEDQLGLVARRFGLDRHPSHCMECNGELESAQLSAVVDQVPSGVTRDHQSFFSCRGCGRVFWYGSHWERIAGRLERVFE
jgi:uncharacterized protein with PIN domain